MFKKFNIFAHLEANAVTYFRKVFDFLKTTIVLVRKLEYILKLIDIGDELECYVL